MNRAPPGPGASRGQSSVEYVLLCGVLAVALGLWGVGDDSALRLLLDALARAYQNLSFALALP
jgi:hypothetical protein